MEINHFLLEKKPEILKKWFDLIVETYPPDTASFLKSQKNRFSNPVGRTILDGIEGIFEELLRGMERNRVLPFLENIIKIRALQNFTPSQALNFVFFLKKVIREEISGILREHQLYEELLELESTIDALSRLSFDIYMQCREKFHELRVNELRNLTRRALQGAERAHEGTTDKSCVTGFMGDTP